MKLYAAVLFPLFIGVCLGGCPKLKTPKFGKMHCSDPQNGDEVCTFSCKSWTNMIGKDMVTCNTNGQWDSFVPVCYPDYTKCNKKYKERCPKISTDDMEHVKEIDFREFNEEEKNAINFIVSEFQAHKMKRNPSKFKCIPQMCKVECILLNFRKLANRCVRCKKRRIIKCRRGGGLFLN